MPSLYDLGASLTPPDDTWLEREAHRLLDGAAPAVAPGGGFWWLTADGSPDRDRGRQLWITARMTHVFSLGVLLGRSGDAAAADHGVQSLAGRFYDRENGGWFAVLDEKGRPPGTPDGTAKGAYEHAFVLLAAASATIAGRPGASQLLELAADTVLRRFWDDEAGAMVERWDRGWTVAEPYRGANANMHAVEAFLTAADAGADPAWRGRAARIARRIVAGSARAHGWRIPEHFDADWGELPEYNRDRPDDRFRPYGVTPGHGLEWSRLLLHLDAALRRAGEPAEDWLVDAAVALFDRALADGWDTERGGFVYTTGDDGRPVVRRRFHWVVCEAIGAAAALTKATADPRYRAVYAACWDHARSAFIEPAGGVGWVQELDERNQPTSVTWPGRPDWYHALQATLIPRLPLAPTLPAALAAGAHD